MVFSDSSSDESFEIYASKKQKQQQSQPPTRSRRTLRRSRRVTRTVRFQEKGVESDDDNVDDGENELRPNEDASDKEQEELEEPEEEYEEREGQEQDFNMSGDDEDYQYTKADGGSDSNASSGESQQDSDSDDDQDEESSGDEWMNRENLLKGLENEQSIGSGHDNEPSDQDKLPHDINRRMKDLFSSDEESSENDSDVSLDALETNPEYQDLSSEEEEARRQIIRKKKTQKLRSSQLSNINQDGRIYLNMARKEYEEGRLQDAILLIEEAIVADPDSRLPYILLDVIHSDMGNESAALKAKIAAAIAGSVSPDDWADAAGRSMAQGLFHQAIPFYIRAIDLDPDEATYRLDLAQAYLKTGSLARAVSTMRRLHNLYPANPNYTSELAKLYLENGQVDEGIALYEDILLDNFKSASLDTTRVQPFGWSELNVLCELYDRNESWVEGISTIKKVARWLLDRASETWWTDVPNDSEFDERRTTVRRFKSSRFSDDDSKFVLPLDIRCKLLMFRLELEDYDEAMIHTKFLLDSDVSTYFDLFWDSANRFMKHRKYQIAQDLLIRLIDVSTPPPLELLQALGKCEMELGRWEDAKERFLEVLEVDEQNIEALVALGEISYALDDVPTAKDYLDSLHIIIREQRAKSKDDDSAEPENQEDAFIQSIRKPRKTNVPYSRDRQKLRQQLKEEMTHEYEEFKHQWVYISENKNNVAAVIKWKQIAYRLVEHALSMRLFTYGKKVHLMLRQNEGGAENGLADRYSMLESKIIQNDIDEDADDEVEYLQESLPSSEVAVKTRSIKQLDNLSVRGLTVENWRSVFIRLALVLAECNDPLDAYQVLAVAKGIKMLRDGHGERILNMVNVSCAYLANDPAMAADIIRIFSTKHEMVNDVYRFFYATVGTSVKSCDIFRLQYIQKYYFRRIKLLNSRQKSGNPVSAIPMTILGFSYIVNRSYSNALDQFQAAEAIAPRDPTILLAIAIAHLLRAMNRLSANRHVQVLQGLAYVMKYAECRKEEGEKHLRRKGEKADVKKSDDEVKIKQEEFMDIDIPKLPTDSNDSDDSNGTDSTNSPEFPETSEKPDEMEEVEDSENSPTDSLETQDTTNWEEQEAYYNTGRAFHSIGLMTEASTWYEKALYQFPDVVPDEECKAYQHEDLKEDTKVDAHDAAYTLKPDTAYNLVQLYSTSGNLKLAREITDKYLVI